MLRRGECIVTDIWVCSDRKSFNVYFRDEFMEIKKVYLIIIYNLVNIRTKAKTYVINLIFQYYSTSHKP